MSAETQHEVQLPDILDMGGIWRSKKRLYRLTNVEPTIDWPSYHSYSAVIHWVSTPQAWLELNDVLLDRVFPSTDDRLRVMYPVEDGTHVILGIRYGGIDLIEPY